jgi:hypothetical protein
MKQIGVTGKVDKGQDIANALRVACESHQHHRLTLETWQLEKETGFLNHLAMTFDKTNAF